ncbi:MAG: VCBS repeat-containing protein [Deltaproteobacteria bacterium]|nr:VCBS repeat-containing protein [Deltaproteobacteria bacterium]
MALGLKRTIPLALLLLLGCGDDDVTPNDDAGPVLDGATLDGGSTDGGARDDGGPSDGGGCASGELTCGDACCAGGEVCVEGACAADCEGVAPCGSGADSVCCDSGDECVAGSCVTPGAACTPDSCGPAAVGCEAGFVCDPALSVCVPSLADTTCAAAPSIIEGALPRVSWGRRMAVACTTDAECQTGETCTDDECTPNWPTNDPADAPDFIHVASLPLVGDLDGDCTPDIVINTYRSPSDSGAGLLRALDGATGAEKWAVTDIAYRTEGTANPALGDIDGDGLPEIVVQSVTTGRLIAIDGDGTPMWTSDSYSNAAVSGSVAIANMDGEGLPEIVFGAAIFDANGALLWEGTGGTGRDALGPISCVADLDGDGRPELIGGNTAYETTGTAGVDFTGSIRWMAPVQDGRYGIADFDGGRPEVVLVANGTVHVIDSTGSVIDSLSGIEGLPRGGTPTIADFNDDGELDIGVSGASVYVVLELEGTDLRELWRATISDPSTRTAGSAAFDFDGDGRFEIVHQDEQFLRIFPGTEPDCDTVPVGVGCDGLMTDDDVLLIGRHVSRTRTQYPVVADLDGDGRAEIVLSSSSDVTDGLDAGVEVWSHPLGTWGRARPVWNQNAYRGVNVNDDGTIPMSEPDAYTSFRSQPADGARDCAANLQPMGLRADATMCPALNLTVDVVNTGCLGASAGISVSFYEESAGLLGTVQTMERIEAGARTTVSLDLGATPNATVWAVVDDDGTGAGRVMECDEENESARVLLCPEG